MDTMTSLYLLMSSDLTKFKIGISSNIENRINNLSKATLPINLEESFEFKWPSRSIAMKAEQSLHFIYDRFRITNMPPGDGYTEWYSYDVLDDVLDTMNKLASNYMIPSEHFKKGILIPEKENSNVSKLKERRKLSEAERMAIIPAYREKNKESIIALYNYLKGLEPYLVKAENKYILGYEAFYCAYNFDNAENLTSEEKPISIHNASLSLSTPTSFCGISIIVGILALKKDTNIYAEVHPYKGLKEMAMNECNKDLSILIDLFTSYNPIYAD